MAWLAWITLSGSTRSLTARRRAQVSVAEGQRRVDLLLGEVEVVAGADPRRQRGLHAVGVGEHERAHLGVERQAARRTGRTARRRRRPRRGPGAARRSAPPTWRSSTHASGEPEPGPACASSASIASAGSCVHAAPCRRRTGIGSSGSWCRRTSAGAGTIANVSISGCQRAQRRRARPGRPGRRRRSSRASGRARAPGSPRSGGSCMIRNEVVTWSGASTAHCAQAVSTRSASVQSQSMKPA